MPKSKPGAEAVRYEVITQETPDGDVIIPIPEPILRQMGWKEGDDVEIEIDQEGKLYLKKK
jgi:hypothetical protein